MKISIFTLFIILLLNVGSESISKDFSPTPIIWNVPTGGQVNSSGHSHGFNTTESTLNYYENDEGWTTQDIDGDGKPDLIVTGVGNGFSADVFSNGSNPYWKVYLNDFNDTLSNIKK